MNGHRARSAAVGVLALLLLAAAVFRDVGGFGFIRYDDEEYVTRNVRVRAGLTAPGAAWALRSTEMGNWHPLTWLSLMLDVSLFGADPGRMHEVNLLVHAATGALLFLALRAMTGAALRSLLVAALFIAHPLHVESVAWVSERKDVLAALFWMLATCAYVGYARRPGGGRLLLAGALLALGLLAKPMPVSLPLVLLLLDWWPLGRLRPGGPRAASLVLEKLPLFALAAAAAVVARIAQEHAGAVATLARFPLPVRAGNALVAYGWYLVKAAWPSRLAFFYPHPGAALSWAAAAGSGALLAGATLAVLRLRRSAPWLAVGWLWYLVTLLPVIGLLQVGDQAWADRYSYLPLVGVFVMLAWGAAPLVAPGTGRRAAAAAAVVVWVAALAAAAHAQAAHWRSSAALSRHAAEVAPSWLALEDLGVQAQVEGRPDEALALLRRALALAPANPQVSYNLGWVHERRGDWGEAEAAYRQAAALDPREPASRTALGVLLASLGRDPEAVAWLEEALRLAPDSPRAHGALGGALLRLGDRGGAERHLLEAVRLDPADAGARRDLGRLYLAEGRRREASAQIEAVLRARQVDGRR